MPEPSATPENDEVLIVDAGGDRLALLATEVQEIIRPPVLTRVPHSPPNLLGVANLRGLVLPVVSLAGLLGSKPQAETRSTRVVVVNGLSPVGLLVDAVTSLTRTSEGRRIELGELLGQAFRTSARLERKVLEPESDAGTQDEAIANERVFLAFAVAGQEYALPIAEVVSIATTPDAMASLPRTDAAMLGVAELDGALVPLVSARLLLGFTRQDGPGRASRIVLTRLGEGIVGLVVDGMREIIRVTPEMLDPVPPVLTRGKGEAQVEAICRLDNGNRLISILASEKLFDPETVARVLAQSELGTQQMSRVETETEAATQQFIVFRLGEESYGLPIGSIDEIVRCPENFTRVPRAPKFVKGLMSLRGKALAVIDQRQRFSVPGKGGDANQRIIVVTFDSLQAGFLVDSVSEVLTLSAADLSPAPELGSDTSQVIDRVATIKRDGHMILLVDPKALLDRAERDLIGALGKTAEAAKKP
jgi:purine-binding chemotaxis protein CheW